MELSALEDAELLALVGLAKMIIRADSQLSGDEIAGLKALAAAVGEPRFTQHIARANEQLASREAVILHAMTIERAEAKQAMYDALHVLAAVDGIVEREQEILDWVKAAYALE